jgi:hypothetical protein
MTLRTSAPHAKRRWAGLAGTVAIAMMLLVGGALAASGTGASVVDYAQCANGKPGTTPSDDCNKGMIFGILNANNSQYAEDQVTAQRLILSLPAGGSVNGRTIQLKWLVRKAGNHAYDSLATWDYTINGTVANACLGLSGPVKNTCITDFNAGAPASEPIDLDGAVVTPDTNGGGGVTSNHQLTGQNVEMFGLGAGGDIDDFSCTGRRRSPITSTAWPTLGRSCSCLVVIWPPAGQSPLAHRVGGAMATALQTSTAARTTSS